VAADPAAPHPLDPVVAGPAAARWRGGFPARPLAAGFAKAGLPGIVAAWAAALVLLGAAPLAAAQLNRVADPIIAQAIAGSAAPLDLQAPPFQLTDQNGRPVSLASLRGKVILLTFLDPVCTTDCPIIAQEFRAADQMLGARARRVELVAVVANPIYYGTAYLRAFDRQEGMSALPNWEYLTGSAGQLQQLWARYGVTVQGVPAGGMVAHNDLAYVIDGSGRIRAELNMETGPGSASSRSSFAAVLAHAAGQALAAGK
jgi:cytochrome oxidase Cu insertion factor (SCO1/SenC/PrrC family)